MADPNFSDFYIVHNRTILMTDNASSECSGGIIVYFHRLLRFSQRPGLGWQQSHDIVRYVDPTSTADPETSGHEASQPCSSSEGVFQESLRDHSVDPSSVFCVLFKRISLWCKY